MIEQFIKVNYEIVDFEEVADIYVINTCTVTNMSDRKSRQMLRKAKDINENSVVVAVGCYVQVAKEELEKIPEIDLCIGTNEKKDIVKYVTEFIENKTKLDKIDDVFKNKEYSDFGNITYSFKVNDEDVAIPCTSNVNELPFFINTKLPTSSVVSKSAKFTFP